MKQKKRTKESEIIKEIRQKKELAGIGESIVKDALKTTLSRYKIKRLDLDNQKAKIIIKETRAELRKIVGRFQKGTKSRSRFMKEEDIENLLQSHTSTSERAEFYPELKNRVRSLKVRSILDIGCGLNPIALAPAFPKTKYYAADIKEDELDLIKEFFKKENWYNKMGIPYRRGYLLYGCPGTGKTSLVKALAGELDIPIYILNISKDMKEENFQSLILSVPQKSIIAIEDIDCLFTSKRKIDGKYNITFKTILNAIDGLISPYGTILFLTTNHKLKLSSALLRPGRIDRQYKIDKMDKEQIEDFFKLFYPNTKYAKRFADKIEPNKYTPAQMQKYFIDRPDINIVLKETNKIKEK